MVVCSCQSAIEGQRFGSCGDDTSQHNWFVPSRFEQGFFTDFRASILQARRSDLRSLLQVTPKKPFLSQDKNYVLAEFPHTVFPMGSWINLPLIGLPETGVQGPTAWCARLKHMESMMHTTSLSWRVCVCPASMGDGPDNLCEVGRIAQQPPWRHSVSHVPAPNYQAQLCLGGVHASR